MMHFITGGARSGKSRYAQTEALKHSASPLYLATARYNKGDEKFANRIHRHRHKRDERWTTIEEPLYPSKQNLSGKTAVLHCVTLWLSNVSSLHKYNIDDCLQHLQQETEGLQKQEARLFVISNEIGMGVHAETEIGRAFTDLQGWANQYLAQQAGEVVCMVSGIAMVIKSHNP